MSGHKCESVWIKWGMKNFWGSAKQKLVEMEIRRKLNFDDHVPSICTKAGRKIGLLNPYENIC